MTEPPTITDLRPFIPQSPVHAGKPLLVTFPGPDAEVMEAARCYNVLSGKITAEINGFLAPLNSDRMYCGMAVWTFYEFGMAQQRAQMGRELFAQGKLPETDVARFVATARFDRVVGEVHVRG